MMQLGKCPGGRGNINTCMYGICLLELLAYLFIEYIYIERERVNYLYTVIILKVILNQFYDFW